MTGDEYVMQSYSRGQVYDFEMGSWREPMTQKELELMRFYSELTKLSLRRADTDAL